MLIILVLFWAHCSNSHSHAYSSNAIRVGLCPTEILHARLSVYLFVCVLTLFALTCHGNTVQSIWVAAFGFKKSNSVQQVS